MIEAGVDVLRKWAGDRFEVTYDAKSFVLFRMLEQAHLKGVEH